MLNVQLIIFIIHIMIDIYCYYHIEIIIRWNTDLSLKGNSRSSGFVELKADFLKKQKNKCFWQFNTISCQRLQSPFVDFYKDLEVQRRDNCIIRCVCVCERERENLFQFEERRIERYPLDTKKDFLVTSFANAYTWWCNHVLVVLRTTF